MKRLRMHMLKRVLQYTQISNLYQKFGLLVKLDTKFIRFEFQINKCSQPIQMIFKL